MILPIDVTNVLIDVLRRRHPEHLGKLEQDRGKKAGTYERLAFDVMARPNGRLRTQKAPIALAGVVTPLDQTVEANNTVTVTWQFLIEVHVEGQARNRADLLMRRDVYAWSVIETVLQRVPRGRDSFITALDLADVEAGDSADPATAEVHAVAVLDFDVTVRAAFDVTGLPPDDSPLPPGSPGGPPADPGTPAVPWPGVTSFTETITREAPDG